MIKSFKDLKEFLEIEKKIYVKMGYSNRVKAFITKSEIGYLYKYVRLLRLEEYIYNTKKNVLLLIIIKRKRNTIGLKLGINIPINVFDYRLNNISSSRNYCKY